MSAEATTELGSPLSLPRHVAVIMDGNGRWARERNLPRIKGHERGAKAARELVEEAARRGIQFLTLYAFSVDNWRRPAEEVGALMGLLEHFLKGHLRELMENNIRLRTIGRLQDLPKASARQVTAAVKATRHNTGLELILALSYGARVEIVEAVQALAREVKEGRLEPGEIDEEMISSHLYTAGVPDPDLLIRTSGEMRLSNFLLWQLSYTEIFVTPTLWPDFTAEEFGRALREFTGRQRRFGGV